MTLTKQRVFLLALNEFNFDLLEEGARTLSLPHLQTMLSFHRTHTFTEETYESNLLEPWVQWVSVHTGTPASEHHIQHLGDVPHLKTPQLWEQLHARGVTSGIWGAMNGCRNQASLFFFPDPWTASESAFPPELAQLLNPLRSLSKQYGRCSYFDIAQQSRSLFALLQYNQLSKSFLRTLPRLLLHALQFRGQHFVFISWLEELATQLFLKYKQRYQPDLSFLFLNSIAHLQHHHWHANAWTPQSPLAHGLRALDRMLARLLHASLPNELFLVVNALSQTNTQQDPPWILYRQRNQTQFLHTVGIPILRVEELMTHDALLFFATPQDARKAQDSLTRATLQGKPLFYVESYPEEPTKLFYRLQYTDAVPQHAQFILHDRSWRFFDLFTAIVQRTGKHIPQGTVLANRPFLPPTMANHELAHHILRLYAPAHTT